MTAATPPLPHSDRIAHELVKGALNAARREMEALIARTAMSPFIREKKDFFTAVLSPTGDLVVSTSLTLAGHLVEPVLAAYPVEEMRNGDLFWYNDPYATRGAVSHLPDMVFIMPVFSDGRLIAFVEAWGHLWDIGGAVAGSISPMATSVFQEGIAIPPVRAIRAGQRNDEVMRIFARNSRFPKLLEGDLSAIMAACELGRARVEAVAARHGPAVFAAACEAMMAQSAAALSDKIATLPDGQWSFRDRIDSDAATGSPSYVDLTLTKTGTALSMDFTASAPQATGPINFLMHESVPNFMLGLCLNHDDPSVGMNAGFSRAGAQVLTRPGTVLHPQSPAPLGLRSHAMFRVNSALMATLAQATGGQAAAANAVYVLYYLRGRDAAGVEALCIEGLSVGYGARAFADGLDAVYAVAQENYPVEFADMEFGLEIEAFGLNRDSGGPGRFRGGCGITRDIRVLSDSATLGIRIDNCRYPAFGVNGGMAGGAGRVTVNPGSAEARDIATMGDGTALKSGDLLRIVTPGGGGWGCPLDRPAEDVLGDVLDGFVSDTSARRDYGVVIAAGALDVGATEALRAQMPRPRAMFHRGGYYDAKDDRNS
ncbi:MAG: hydantoinase B/oxoprolinase family protein [Pseudomonadota bacterium]